MRVAFFGCGFLTTWLAPALIKLFMSRVRDLSIILIDAERVEPENLENSMFVHPYAGQYKTTNFSRLLRMVFPSLKITPVNMRVKRTNIGRIPDFDFAVCTFDNFESRKVVNDYCTEKNLDLLHVGVGDLSSVAVVWREDFYKAFRKRTQERVCERVDMIKMALLASSLALKSVEEYLDKGRKVSYIATNFRVVKISYT